MPKYFNSQERENIKKIFPLDAFTGGMHFPLANAAVYFARFFT